MNEQKQLFAVNKGFTINNKHIPKIGALKKQQLMQKYNKIYSQKWENMMILEQVVFEMIMLDLKESVANLISSDDLNTNCIITIVIIDDSYYKQQLLSIAVTIKIVIMRIE